MVRIASWRGTPELSARAAILGLGGPSLTPEERSFFREANPWGFILFSRNVDTPVQLRELTSDLRDCVGRNAPILIDQEGGRVARMGPPHWRQWQPVMNLFDGADEDAALLAARLRYRIIADELRSVGIDVNCAPLLDVPIESGHEVIGARALGRAAEDVARRGRAICESLLAGGVLPVIKHIPGHGRASVDSHVELPRVSIPRETLTQTDFAPFKALADQALGMTAHVVFEALDPATCATLSTEVIAIIRQEIGFDGLLMTDDLSMQALSGSMHTRAENALAAGCDVILHCNGEMAEMQAVASATPQLAGDALRRARAAEALRREPDPENIKDAAHQYESLTGERIHV